MTNRDRDVAALLEEIVPPTTTTAARSDSWDAIVREAGAPRRRFLLRGVPASVVALAACLLIVLAWPFGGSGRSGVLDRALAALGHGPVLHVVREGGWGGTLVDLGSGARTEYPGIDEDWYDAGRNLQRHVLRLGGVVQDDASFHPSRAPADIVGLAKRYRESLQNGSAVVASEGDVDGTSVDWIKVLSELLPDVADGKLHEWAQEIAVSRDTFEPVATRDLRDGVDSGDSLQRIRKLEYVSEDAAGFRNPDEPRVLGPFAFSAGFDDELSIAQARAVLPDFVWPGDEVAGLPFARAAKLEYKSGYDRARGTWANVMTGVALAYGRLADPRARRFDGGSVVVRETPRRPIAGASVAFTPPPGKAYVSHGSAVLESHGVFVQVQAPDDATALAAARAVSAGSAARR